MTIANTFTASTNKLLTNRPSDYYLHKFVNKLNVNMPDMLDAFNTGFYWLFIFSDYVKMFVIRNHIDYKLRPNIIAPATSIYPLTRIL